MNFHILFYPVRLVILITIKHGIRRESSGSVSRHPEFSIAYVLNRLAVEYDTVATVLNYITVIHANIQYLL